MAGIGFELRKLMQQGSLLGFMQAYAYAGIISSGPWVLSIIGILIIGLFSLGDARPALMISQFQVSITYLIAGSLVLTGLLQLAFTRFTADRLYEHQDDLILPAFNGLVICTTVIAGLLAGGVVMLMFPAQPLGYKLLMTAGFVVMCNIWIAAIFLAGMKQYKAVLLIFALGYGASVVLSLHLRHSSLQGIMEGFLAGQLVLLLGLTILVNLEYPSEKRISFSFIRKLGLYPSLIFTGFFYNAGVWIDKLMFWTNPYTGVDVIGPLRASPIYDIPVFLAYLSIIPGMAVFLVRLETDFVEHYDGFYNAIRSGGSLQEIERRRNAMVMTLRQGVIQIIAVQAVVVVATATAGGLVLRLLGISDLYLPLLCVNVIAAAVQVVFLGVLTVLFYIDKRREALLLTSMFFFLNWAFTAATLQLGPRFYGFGFAAALLVVVCIGFHLLDRRLDSLEYETFMLQ